MFRALRFYRDILYLALSSLVELRLPTLRALSDCFLFLFLVQKDKQ